MGDISCQEPEQEVWSAIGHKFLEDIYGGA